MLSLREATPDDLEPIRDLLHAIDLSSDGVQTPGSRYWIAELNGRVIGTIGLEYGSDAVLLRSAGVAPEARGNGVGAALLRQALAAARADGYRRVFLFSTGAGPYWQRHGFVEVPVAAVVAALPDAFQVRYYAEHGWLPTEVAWEKQLAE